MVVWTMKTPINTLTPTDLMETIKSLQSLLHSKERINVQGIKGRIRKLKATLIATTKCHSGRSAEQGDVKAVTSPSCPQGPSQNDLDRDN